ncbi:hypothetical protein VW29_09375 [Devosia limi DSM 17137]|uniref:Uncharacterized protein n=1 Tax=Devosia limi DSM 17137 TaxID=1121477 RepID=A0A0F5LQH2_9HYPH|nr:hypothetical protein VW29_09375 [Devosia limi DSM 17137]
MRHHNRINFGIANGLSHRVEFYAAPWPLLSSDYATPLGSRIHDAFNVFRRCHECQLLQSLTIDADLHRHPV